MQGELGMRHLAESSGDRTPCLNPTFGESCRLMPANQVNSLPILMMESTVNPALATTTIIIATTVADASF